MFADFLKALQLIVVPSKHAQIVDETVEAAMPPRLGATNRS